VATVAGVPDIERYVASGRRAWLVTGAAGFIGSHLVQALLRLGQQVRGLDNFSTGKRENLEQVRERVGADAAQRFEMVEGDIADPAVCEAACRDVEVVLHQAALGSVPRSLEDPLATHRSNVTGFLDMLVAARAARVRRFVYAGSSSTYGDHPSLPKKEDVIGHPLSPYAATKFFDEIYAEVFGRCYGTETVGLRYFNVFGPRQDPDGPYAAVIPRWARQMLTGDPCVIYGDGETSRDFCYVDNVVQANLRAALVAGVPALGQVYNVAAGGRTSLNELHGFLAGALRERRPGLQVLPVQYAAFRGGDVRHSQADIAKARDLLGYVPNHDVRSGLRETAGWYLGRFSSSRNA
jgi:UDP-N-acetylglucosamine 4-epimerase